MSRAAALQRQREALIALSAAQRRLLTVQVLQAADTVRPALRVLRLARLAMHALQLWHRWRRGAAREA